VRRYQPSTVPRRLSIVVGFYRLCVIDGLFAGRLRAPPTVPPESPTLRSLLIAARLSDNPNDFALVAMLGLLGLRIFEACEANIGDLGKEHGRRVLRVVGKGGRVVLLRDRVFDELVGSWPSICRRYDQRGQLVSSG
jgi:integrase/recombinase XerD